MGATEKRLRKLGSGALKKIYRENDRTRYTSKSIKIAKEILEERGEEIPERRSAKGKGNEDKNGSKKSEDKKNEEGVEGIRDKLDQLIDKVSKKEDKNMWKHKIISGPVLSGLDELEEKLNELGESGWELVDTQRHSILGKQHAVCFLKKKK